jgi:uncharacterized protein YycO
MRYTDVRPTIKSGDILVWSIKHSWVMKLVSIFTTSKYNHLGVAIVVSGRVMVIEATRNGVTLVPLSEELPCYLISMPDYWNEHIETFAFSQIGHKYSIWEAILAFFNQLKTGDNEVWQCAELVNTILSSCDMIGNVRSVPTDIVEALLEGGLTMNYLHKVQSK